MTDVRSPYELYDLWSQAQREGSSEEVLQGLWDVYTEAEDRRSAAEREALDEVLQEVAADVQADSAARVAEGISLLRVDAVDAVWTPDPARRKLKSKIGKPRRKPEAEVVTEGIAFLNTLSRTWAWKIHGGLHGQVGQPDVDGCSAGRSIKFEAKTTGTKPEGHQLGILRRWAETGALVGWFRDNDHLRQLLAHLDDPTFVPDLTRPGCACPLHS